MKNGLKLQASFDRPIAYIAGAVCLQTYETQPDFSMQAGSLVQVSRTHSS
jgi:hypothetical protein